MALTREEKERLTNRLLYFLSQAPQGLTTRQLQEQTGEMSQEQIVDLLKSSRHVPLPRTATEGGSINIAPNLWNLKKYVPGSEGDEDLKRRIELGSRNCDFLAIEQWYEGRDQAAK